MDITCSLWNLWKQNLESLLWNLLGPSTFLVGVSKGTSARYKAIAYIISNIYRMCHILGVLCPPHILFGCSSTESVLVEVSVTSCTWSQSLVNWGESSMAAGRKGTTISSALRLLPVYLYCSNGNKLLFHLHSRHRSRSRDRRSRSRDRDRGRGGRDRDRRRSRDRQRSGRFWPVSRG